MRLPVADLDLQHSLEEFDIWITPSLGDIRDTERFKEELDRIADVFDTIGAATSAFESPESCDPDAIASTFVGIIGGLDEPAARDALAALASVLFLVTGRSDNNAKCQFPLHLRDVAGWSSIPTVGTASRGGANSLSEATIPRELKAERVMRIVAGLSQHPDAQMKLLREFVRFVLMDGDYVSQLWSIGRSYFALKSVSRQRDLLKPLVVFQVRGSVAASGGHDPEDLLREKLAEWGLEPGVDYNLTDAVLDTGADQVVPSESEAAKGAKSKTRAYDFILPFRVAGWEPRIFIQCQFYAGDSGSVSHKNVDQTTTSRSAIASVLPGPVFIEYVDGAGYFSSLNGDLKILLSMDSTSSFFQVRTAPIRLRRALQEIGFLTPLEIEHSILRGSGETDSTAQILQEEGYSGEEITRAIASSLDRGLLTRESANRLQVTAERRRLARRYFLLDTIAIRGATLKPGDDFSGMVLVPGYGPFHGLPLDDLAETCLGLAPALSADWQTPQQVLDDLDWLRQSGMIITA